jgi:hypothetical protein
MYHPPYEAPPLSGLYGAASFGAASSLAPEACVHFPKGHHKAGRKPWQRYTAWVPPAATAAAPAAAAAK